MDAGPLLRSVAKALVEVRLEVDLGGINLRVADLSDIIASKRAAGRPRDQAVLEILEATQREKNASA